MAAKPTVICLHVCCGYDQDHDPEDRRCPDQERILQRECVPENGNENDTDDGNGNSSDEHVYVLAFCSQLQIIQICFIWIL